MDISVLKNLLSNQWRTVKIYRTTEDIKVPRTGRTEHDNMYSDKNILLKDRIVFVRWDETFPNLIELEYPGINQEHTILFSFNIVQWKKIFPFLVLQEREYASK